MLRTGSRVILGKNHVFRFHHPEQVWQEIVSLVALWPVLDEGAFSQARREEQAQVAKEEGKDLSPSRDANDNKADWDFAHSELLEREGVDLKVEMEQKMKEMEELWRKEKEEATQAFQQERKKYEDQIETLQKQVLAESVQTIQTKALSQVMEQSMTMSMISSTCGGGDDFTQEEDLYGW